LKSENPFLLFPSDFTNGVKSIEINGLVWMGEASFMKQQIEEVAPIILAEVNVKALEVMEDTAGVVVKKIKPNFKSLGARMGAKMKVVAGAISALEQNDIRNLEKTGAFHLFIDGESVSIDLNDVEIISEDIPGWLVAVEGSITVALDIHISENLRKEGLAREFINRVQNFRKSSGLEVTDRIKLGFHISSTSEIIATSEGSLVTRMLERKSLCPVSICQGTDEGLYSVSFFEISSLEISGSN
jgi:isoleucyl-tRNA synthetase